MEERNVVYLTSLKCDESNHYKSNCQLYQRSFSLCTFSGEYKMVRSYELFKTWGIARFLYSIQKRAMPERT
jgi:hypothetical protein